MNNEQELIDNGTMLPLVEEFYTLQGEGFNTGKAAYFIRIGGCDIGCKWCDSKFSWNPDIHKPVLVDEIVQNTIKYPAKAIVVTGGEPLNYNLDYLCNQLKLHKVETFLETAGNRKLSGKWDWICLSPKQTAPPLDENLYLAHELKVIVNNENDLLWADECSKKVNKHCILYLQPEWSAYNKMIHIIVDYIKENPQWKISLQSHKFMNIP